MSAVLIVEDDPSFATTLARSLEGERHRVTVASSVEQAFQALSSTRFDVLLTDLRLQDRDGIDLLAMVRALPDAPRAILMSGFASARDHQTATELGAVRVLCKPFTPRDLLEAVRQAEECESGFHGTVHGMSLVDLLQMFHLARRSVTVRVGGSTPAILHLDAGDVVHATRGERVGVDAFVRTLNTRTGSVQTAAFDPTVPRTIAAPFDVLLLDALRAGDEYRRDSHPMPIVDELQFDFGEVETDAFAEAREAWQRAATLVGPTLESATVVAFVDGETATLQGTLDADTIGHSARSVLDVARRFAGDGECGCWEYVSGGMVFAVFRAPRGAYALSVVDAVPQPSGLIWFRSAVATIRRIVGASDK